LEKIAIMSGKGGVGKTTVTLSLCNALLKEGYKVGVLDADLTGANIYNVLGKGEIDVAEDINMFLPAEVKLGNNNLQLMSLAHIIADGEPVLWEDLDFASAAQQLLEKTKWDKNTDFLLIDVAPGTPPENQVIITLMDSVLLVTLPSFLSDSNLIRSVELCREFKIPILGVVNNLTHYECSKCGNIDYIFESKASWIEDYNLNVIWNLPIKKEIAKRGYFDTLSLTEFHKSRKSPTLLKPTDPVFKRKAVKFALKNIRITKVMKGAIKAKELFVGK